MRHSRSVATVALQDATSWHAPSDTVDHHKTPGQRDSRLPWPMAVAVILLLSGGLWLGIAWVVKLSLS